MSGDVLKCYNFVYSPDFISEPNSKLFISKNKESGIYHVSSEGFICP
jgi:hypothetical protein